MEYVLKLTTNHTVEIIEKPENVEYDWYADKIGCEWIEIVRPRYFNHKLIVDEEGRLKTNKMNIIASAMYGTFEHGEPIVGDVLVVEEGLVNDEPSIIGFTLHEANRIKNYIEDDMRKSIKFRKFINQNM